MWKAKQKKKQTKGRAVKSERRISNQTKPITGERMSSNKTNENKQERYKKKESHHGPRKNKRAKKVKTKDQQDLQSREQPGRLKVENQERARKQ